jgi:uncharacterized membrane protein
MRRLLLLALLGAAVLPSSAAAKGYSLPLANVSVTVAPDSSLLVKEEILFSFYGSFTGAYRDIPLRPGEKLDRVSITEEQGDRTYRPGASAELGSSGVPDTFGVARLPDRVRIVWHYQAADETRQFTIAYRLRGVAVAYDDVVDVNLKVWGDQWPVGLSTLGASVALPGEAQGPRYRVWGHPRRVEGTVERRPTVSLLTASNVPPKQFVEMRVVFPRRLVSSTAGARVVHRPGLASIVAEEQAVVDRYENGRRKVRDALDHLPRTIAYLLLLAVGPALLLILLVWLVYGREPRTGYDREYEQEPPTNLPPALVPALLHEHKSPDNVALAFTATLFDLIQRGRYKATPVTSEQKRWGGERTESVSDLELQEGNVKGKLRKVETPVAEVLDDVLDEGPVLLTRLQGRIAAERKENARRFLHFQSGISSEIGKRKWYVPGSGGKVLGWSIPAFIAAGIVLLVVGGVRLDSTAPVWGDVLLIVFGLCCFPNALVLLFAVFNVRLWRKRSLLAQVEAERWAAFRRYLTDFPRLGDAPAATLELWERYLVYGISFGLAGRVLAAAHLYMPRELHDESSIYWITANGSPGSGASALGIDRLVGGFASAFTPPASPSSSSSSSFSSSSGFGGSFSGGGGGGRGGGGGGAW